MYIVAEHCAFGLVLEVFLCRFPITSIFLLPLPLFATISTDVFLCGCRQSLNDAITRATDVMIVGKRIRQKFVLSLSVGSGVLVARNIITAGANHFRCAEGLFQPKTCELPDGNRFTVGAKCLRYAEVLFLPIIGFTEMWASLLVPNVGNLHVFKRPDNFNGRGICSLKCVTAHPCWFGEDLDRKLSSELMGGHLQSAITVSV